MRLSVVLLLGVLAIAQAQPTRGVPQVSGPPAGYASVRASGSSLGRIRLGAADPLWFTWQIGIPSDVFRVLTWSEAAAKADALGLATVEGVSTQKVSPEIPKNLDWRLMPGERVAVLSRLRDLNMKMPAYRVVTMPDDEGSRRKLFEFAKALSVETVIASPDPAALGALDALADEFGINLAVENRGVAAYADPNGFAAALNGRSKRIGICADLSNWIQRGVKPLDALPLVKGRLMAVRLRDRSAVGAKGRDVVLGTGIAGISEFLLEAYRLELKPLFLTVDGAEAEAEMERSLDGLEKALQPAMKARVAQIADSPQGAIRGPDRLPAEMKRQIEAAVPSEAPARPKKPRKLLVVDLNMWSGHGTIPHGNLLLELLGKKTGAFEAVFSNDLSNLKYDKIRQYDAVFLNNVVGMVFPDPEVREGLMRFVREGGGLGGIHGTTYAALDWPEFSDMLGGTAGAHHTETQFLKIDDPNSPLTKQFGGKSFEHTDEFYHFPAASQYSREKVHVLLSIDVEKSDLATLGRMCSICTRPDHDYAMSWIRSYGKGRVFCTPLGHTPILFTTRAWVQHILSGVQFILGDLEADTTPSAKLPTQK